MSSFPEPRASSVQAVQHLSSSVARVADDRQRKVRALHALDTLVDECTRLGFSQVAGATGAARFAEALDLIDHDTYLQYLQLFNQAGK